MKKFLVPVLFLAALLIYLPLNSANAANAMMGAKKVSVKAGAAAMHKTMQQPKMTAKQAKLIAFGKKLFYSSSIGTNGFSCATCHVYSAGTYISMHGRGMIIMTVKNAEQKIAAFNKMRHMHMTLAGKLNMCDKMALKGPGLSGRKLKALVAYIKSL
jgi:cytochrome c peroxidase